MKETQFNKIQSKLNTFKFSSMKYVEYEEISDYEVKVENDNIIMIYGYDREAKINEYHWATNKLEYLVEYLHDKKDFLITFIPDEWVSNLEQIGFVISNAFHDYFMNDLDGISYSGKFDFLTVDRCEDASKVTMMCKNQSRGFTGQTVKWMEQWINNTEPSSVGTGTRNNAVLIERSLDDEIIGVLCVATYAHESEKGPIVWIREIAVNPSFQNKGIGRKLILQALSYGKRHNATRAFLAVDERNFPGIHLYTSIGFTPSDDKSQIDMLK